MRLIFAFTSTLLWSVRDVASFSPIGGGVRRDQASSSLPPLSSLRSSSPSTIGLMMMDPASAVEAVSTAVAAGAASSSVILSETEPWVRPVSAFLDPFLNLMSFAMIVRVVLSWYPATNVKEIPWIFAVLPTEPLLKAVRGTIPPAFGVDITPIFWLGVFTFIHEILLGQQGLLTMKIKYGI